MSRRITRKNISSMPAETIKPKMDFKLFNKKIKEVYRDEPSLSYQTQHSSLSRDYFNIKSKADLDTLLLRAYGNPNSAAEVSKSLHALDPTYAKIVSYYADMFYIRYTILPVQMPTEEEEVSPEDYQTRYREMLQVVDGLNLEVSVPELLEDILVSGSAYVYAEKLNSSKTISLLSLPSKYCRTVLKTNLGTNVIQFDMRYFDQFRGDNKEIAFSYFPKEFLTLYNEYVNDTQNPWKQLNPKFATSFMVNDLAMPPMLNSMAAILEYEQFRGNELTRSDNQLRKIFTHRIPIHEDEIIFDLEEVAAIQKEISKIVRKHEGLETITVFGETEMISLQDEGKVENKQINQAFETIFNSSGINAQIFSSSASEALKINQKVDQAYVWKMISKVNNFVNVIVNNLYKFKPFQAEVTILPITIANEEAQVKNYRENANFGLGKLEAVVATGTKQKHLTDRHRLEEHLQLDEILKPLASSHTTPGGETEDNDIGKNDNKDEKKEDKGDGKEEKPDTSKED